MPADERFFNNEAISDKHTHKQQDLQAISMLTSCIVNVFINTV